MDIVTLIPTRRKRVGGFSVEMRRLLYDPVFHGDLYDLVTSESLTFNRFCFRGRRCENRMWADQECKEYVAGHPFVMFNE